MEENKKVRDSYIKMKKKQKILTIFWAVIIFSIILIKLLMPDFFAISFAIIFILEIVFFIPLSIILFFSRTDTLWDRLYNFFNKF